MYGLTLRRDVDKTAQRSYMFLYGDFKKCLLNSFALEVQVVLEYFLSEYDDFVG